MIYLYNAVIFIIIVVLNIMLDRKFKWITRVFQKNKIRKLVILILLTLFIIWGLSFIFTQNTVSPSMTVYINTICMSIFFAINLIINKKEEKNE